MAPSHPKPSRWFDTLLWGNSIALSWMWGLGLFFSVQFTTQFGLFGLLTFAIPNALGLLAFGLVTHHIARREAGSESLWRQPQEPRSAIERNRSLWRKAQPALTRSGRGHEHEVMVPEASGN